MITIVKHGLDGATRTAVTRFLDAAGATKLGTAYDITGEIPARLVTSVTRPTKPELQGVKQELHEDPQLLEDIAFMFQFFQENARRVTITPEQKTRFKSILERVRRSRA